jgi:tRNA(adenine34) deaminase
VPYVGGGLFVDSADMDQERGTIPSSPGRLADRLEAAASRARRGPALVVKWAILSPPGAATGRPAMDETFMRIALELACQAQQRGEVPVGAVVVLDGMVIGEGFNQPISANDPTAHAEIVAIRCAAARLGNYRLTGAELYVTIEPCQMCVGAMIHARIARVVYGAPEPRAGAIESAMRAHDHPALNHRMEALGGVLEAESRALIQKFFRERRDPEDQRETKPSGMSR